MKETKHLTVQEFDKFKSRITKMYGFKKKIEGFENNLEKIFHNQIVMHNEIKAINKRIDKIQKYIKQYYPSLSND